MRNSNNKVAFRILVLPANRMSALWRAVDKQDTVNRLGVYRALEKLGIGVKLIDQFPFPFNPFAKYHSLFKALDPLRALRVMVMERRADIVLATFESSACLILLLRRIFYFKAKIAIFDISLVDTWKPRAFILNLVISRADAIITLGSNQADYIRSKWATNAQIASIMQQVDTIFYRPANSSETGTILTVGDDAGRDYDTFLKAIQGLDVTVQARSLEISKMKVPANVTVLNERVSDVEYRELFARASIVVIPLRQVVYASGITSLLEALAMGKAIIVSDSPGIRDYIEPGRNCITVKCGDHEGLREAIRSLQSAPERRAALGRRAREFALERCTQTIHARALASIFAELK